MIVLILFVYMYVYIYMLSDVAIILAIKHFGLKNETVEN